MPVEWIECAWCRDTDGPWVVVTDRQSCGIRVMHLCESCHRKSLPAPAPAVTAEAS